MKLWWSIMVVFCLMQAHAASHDQGVYSSDTLDYRALLESLKNNKKRPFLHNNGHGIYVCCGQCMLLHNDGEQYLIVNEVKITLMQKIIARQEYAKETYYLAEIIDSHYEIFADTHRGNLASREQGQQEHENLCNAAALLFTQVNKQQLPNRMFPTNISRTITSSGISHPCLCIKFDGTYQTTEQDSCDAPCIKGTFCTVQ